MRVYVASLLTSRRPALAAHRASARHCHTARMVEHAWVRIAELREDAANEEWEANNPRLAWLRKTLRWLYIRWLNRLKEFRESERGEQLRKFNADKAAQLLSIYLAVTRCGGCRPTRARVRHLSTRSLLNELDQRGIDRSECVERSELLDVLCGEAGAEDDEMEELVLPSPVDKMV